jgi:hypothetical protein
MHATPVAMQAADAIKIRVMQKEEKLQAPHFRQRLQSGNF